MQGYLSFVQGNATGYEPKTMESIMFVVLVVLCALFVQNLISRVKFSLHHSGSIVIITCFYLLFVGIVTNYQVMSIPCSFLANWFATVNQDKHVSHLTGYSQLMCDDSSRSNAYVLFLCNAIVYRFTYQLLLARTSSLGTCPDTNSTLGHFGYTLFHTLLGLQDQTLDQREISIKFLRILLHFSSVRLTILKALGWCRRFINSLQAFTSLLVVGKPLSKDQHLYLPLASYIYSLIRKFVDTSGFFSVYCLSLGVVVSSSPSISRESRSDIPSFFLQVLRRWVFLLSSTLNSLQTSTLFSSFLRWLFTCIMDTVFNFNNRHQGEINGYTRAERIAVVGADVIKLKASASAKVLEKPISALEEITSFNPEELLKASGGTNFFHRVSSWREQVNSLSKHCTSVYMNNVFCVVQDGEMQSMDANGNLLWEMEQVQRHDNLGNPMFQVVRRQRHDVHGQPVFQTSLQPQLDAAGAQMYAVDPANPAQNLQINGRNVPLFTQQQDQDQNGQPIPIMDELQDTDANGNPIPIMIDRQRLDVNGQPIPVMERAVEELGMLWDIWHNLRKAEVLASCALYFQHGEDVDRQNLSWSFDLMLANVDASLKHHVLSECESQPPHARSGPFAFYLIATKVMAASTNLSHNVNTGLRDLQLRHFQGEDVNECVFVLRNILKVLNYGVARLDRTPPNLMSILFDVFQQCSNGQFRGYMQNLRDFHSRQVNTPEVLFNYAQNYYRDIMTSPTRQWLKTKKSRSAFVAGKTKNDNEPPASAANSANDNQTSESSEKQSTGRRQKYVVDRNPPKEGEPTTRTKDGRTEHWCSKCPKGGRWGNHDANGHDAWYKEWREAKAKREAERQAQETSPSSSEPTSNDSQAPSNDAPGSMRRGGAQASIASNSISSMLRRTYVSFNDSDDESF